MVAVAARHPVLRHIFADGGYAGPERRDALKAIGRWTVQIVKRSDIAEEVEVLGGVAERTLHTTRQKAIVPRGAAS